MNNATKFIFQVFVSMALLLGIMAYTVAISQAFVSSDTVLTVIRK